MEKHLVVLGCSATKLDVAEPLPAIVRYDGPAYRVLNSYLRQADWPESLSIAVLSAEHGLIGGLTPIVTYDRRMDSRRALDLRSQSTETLAGWLKTHQRLSLFLGRDYLPALNIDAVAHKRLRHEVVPGAIGMKLNRLHSLLRAFGQDTSSRGLPPRGDRPLYFLPDWDDHVDANFDFANDRFSSASRSARTEQHCIELMQPDRICDGVLVSLAQMHGSKGLLRRFAPTDPEALAPVGVARRFGLSPDQFAFGDCGAFSYAAEPEPTISTEQAASLYQLYGVDLGASVDHIPLPFVTGSDGKRRDLSAAERRRRVKLTAQNAADFLVVHSRRKCTFLPVGIIQSVSVSGYARQLAAYVEMGYTAVAIGGLVPRSDREIAEIAASLDRSRTLLGSSIRDRLWIHFFGVFRPKIQQTLRSARIASFDSATYFRKAWLRSDQNYLAADGNWYAAIRIPLTSDVRTRRRLASSGITDEILEKRERAALRALHEYGLRRRGLDSALQAVAEYDFLLDRSEDHGENLLDAYRRTLKARPWELCKCNVCRAIGIDVLIFRGYNRNKRRGAHNTKHLYAQLQRVNEAAVDADV